MERKYYLRGLGLGIVMTAVIMGIALSGRHKMTDEEIIKRAKELGMVEDTYLVDNAKEEEEPQKGQDIEEDKTAGAKEAPAAQPETPVEKEDDPPEAAKPEEADDTPLPVAKPVEEEAAKETAGEQNKPQPTAKPETAKKDTNEMTRQEDNASSSVKVEKVTIVSGDGSYTVALKLKEAGVVMSAETFDDFLCENGYDKKLRTGTFQIPADASDEQIARIVTGQE